MRADLDTLLTDAGRAPDAPLDTDAMWTRGRRRRAVRRLSAAGGGLAGAAALVLVASSVLTGGVGTAVPEIAPMAPPADADGGGDDADASEAAEAAEAPEAAELAESAEAAEADGTGTSTSTESSSSATVAELEAKQKSMEAAVQLRRERDAEAAGLAEDGPVETAQVPASTPAPAPSPAPAASPDAARSADPCALHQDGEVRSFIDVVAPVADQRVGGSVELIGCSSVPEGTIRYRLTQGGAVLVDSFTTATAGGPGIGEFRETVALPASGRLTLEVFWDSPAGDGERDLGTVTFDAG